MSSRSFTSNKTPLIVSLENPSEDAKSYQTIRVSCGDEYLDIELRRTLRLPPDDAIHSVPAGYGCFPIYLADQYASKLPKSVKGGAFIPIYQREGMWLSFNCLRPFAVKIYTNDLNIISAKPAAPAPILTTKKVGLRRRLSSSLQGQAPLSFQRPTPQDYIVPPKQRWIDGIVKLDGIAQQFVASPVDIVDDGVENTIVPVKIKFEITPTMNKEMWVYVELASEPTVPMLRLEANPKENVRQRIDEMLTKMAIPLKKALRISFDGNAVGLFDTFQSLQVSKGDIVYVYLDQQNSASGHGLGAGLTAGRPIPTSRRSPLKGPGGRGKAQSGGVEQIIHQDFMPSTEWDTKNRVVFPVYLIRACDFKAITGFNPPPTPVNAAVYEEHKFEFPDEYIEPGVVEEPVVDAEEEDEGEENQKPQGEENVYELSAFEDDSLEFSPRQMKSLSIRNFV